MGFPSTYLEINHAFAFVGLHEVAEEASLEVDGVAHKQCPVNLIAFRAAGDRGIRLTTGMEASRERSAMSPITVWGLSPRSDD